MKSKSRVEHDLIGEKAIDTHHLYGIQTQRAIENFEISGVKLDFYKEFMQAFAMVKMAAAKANNSAGFLSDEITAAICRACEEIVDGQHYEHFMVDMI